MSLVPFKINIPHPKDILWEEHNRKCHDIHRIKVVSPKM